MIPQITLTIERAGSDFPVEVDGLYPALGIYVHPLTGAATDYPLTEEEQEEARRMLEAASDHDECEPDYWQPSRRESDNAANAYFGYIGAQRERSAP